MIGFSCASLLETTSYRIYRHLKSGIYDFCSNVVFLKILFYAMFLLSVKLIRSIFELKFGNTDKLKSDTVMITNNVQICVH